jgi:hypothetical protein
MADRKNRVVDIIDTQNEILNGRIPVPGIGRRDPLDGLISDAEEPGLDYADWNDSFGE